MRGRDAVVAHLAEQAQEVRFAVRPLTWSGDDHAVAVTVHQVVRDADGDLLSDTTVLHTLTLRDGLVGRLDVGEPPP